MSEHGDVPDETKAGEERDPAESWLRQSGPFVLAAMVGGFVGEVVIPGFGWEVSAHFTILIALALVTLVLGLFRFLKREERPFDQLPELMEADGQAGQSPRE